MIIVFQLCSITIKADRISFDLSHTKTNDTFWNETKRNEMI